MDAAFTVVLCQCRLANLILNGHTRRAVVSVMPQSLPATAVPPETRSRPSSYCMVAAVMSLELHGWGNHALWFGAAEAGVMEVHFRFRFLPSPQVRREQWHCAATT